MTTTLANAAAALSDQLRAWRRHLHAHPELSFEERETAAFVARELREMGYAPSENVGGTFGLTAELPGKSKRIVALRADMDALPIAEASGAEYVSRRDGVMHACGHDAHTAMLLGAARLLAERRAALPHSVRLVFQPAEEVYPGGAQPMIAAGALDGVDSIFGLHISSQLPAGTLGTRRGPLMSALNRIELTVRGRGGHAAMPEQCIDPIAISAHIIVALQTIVSRSIAMTDSAVVTITQINAGSADNIIPQDVKLRGTIRVLDESVRATILRRVREVCEGVAGALGGSVELALPEGYPVLVNDAKVVERALAAAAAVGFEPRQILDVPPQGGAEDFAYYCRKAPGAFAFLGARNEAKKCVYPHHHPQFDVDEDVLASGAALLAQYAMQG